MEEMNSTNESIGSSVVSASAASSVTPVDDSSATAAQMVGEAEVPMTPNQPPPPQLDREGFMGSQQEGASAQQQPPLGVQPPSTARSTTKLVNRTPPVQHSRRESMDTLNTTSTPGCFFADATLDLEEAHGMADTPEPTKKFIIQQLGGFGSHNQMQQQGYNNINSTTNQSRFNSMGVLPENRANRGSKEGLLLELPNLDQSAEDTKPTATSSTSKINNGNTSTSNQGSIPISNMSNRNSSPSSTQNKSIMNQITNEVFPQNNNHNGSNNSTNLPTYRPRPPRYPRDVSWSIAMLTFLTFSLLLLPPHLHYSKINNNNEDTHSDGVHNIYYNWTSFHSNRNILLLFNTIATLLTSILLLGRTFYLSQGGGDGDDTRFRAGTLLIISNIFTWVLYGILALQVYWLEEDTIKHHNADADNGVMTITNSGKTMLNTVMLGLLFMCIYEFYVFSTRVFDSTSSFAAHHHQQQQNSQSLTSSSATERIIMTSRGIISDVNPLWNGRQVSFFRELVSTSLDILSRSLRFQSFYRVVCALVFVQFLLVWLWHHALVAIVLGNTTTVVNDDGSTTLRSSKSFGLSFMVFLVCVGGWWGSNVIRRVLGLIASGGVTAWFAQQSLLLEEMKRMKGASSSAGGESVDHENDSSAAASSVSSLDGEGGNASKGSGLNPTMPEAYRIDASAYSPAIEFDEGIDDDYEDEEDYNNDSMKKSTFATADGRGFGSNPNQTRNHGTAWTGGGSGGTSTVKSFLMSALTVSLGSVSKGALLGGIAHRVWWMIRKLDSIKAFFSRLLGYTRLQQSGFQGMNMGNEQSPRYELWRKFVQGMIAIEVMAKKFARSNSELALCHVAAYFKSYQRAADDVMELIDAAGVEPILFDDISSHMCSSISKFITAFLTIMSGQILLHLRSEHLTDVVVCQIMIISYIMCYTMVFTLMEPLRASIQAVYVCFAQHPQSLSQAFPLVYHRLSRISDDNIV